jgi:hypothetical protein
MNTGGPAESAVSVLALSGGGLSDLNPHIDESPYAVGGGSPQILSREIGEVINLDDLVRQLLG